MEALGSYLEDNISIKDVKIGNCGITDKGVDILSLHLIGNTNLEQLGLQFNLGITEESTPFILDIAQKSHIKRVTLSRTMISEESQEIIKMKLETLIENRDIPIQSKTKSASKIKSTVA